MLRSAPVRDLSAERGTACRPSSYAEFSTFGRRDGCGEPRAVKVSPTHDSAGGRSRASDGQSRSPGAARPVTGIRTDGSARLAGAQLVVDVSHARDCARDLDGAIDLRLIQDLAPERDMALLGANADHRTLYVRAGK